MPCASDTPSRTPVNAPGTAAHRDRVQRVAADACLGQQRIGHRQHQFGVPARRDLAARDQFVAVNQGDGAGFGGSFDGEQVHVRSIIAAGVAAHVSGRSAGRHWPVVRMTARIGLPLVRRFDQSSCRSPAAGSNGPHAGVSGHYSGATSVP
jgi:hypothetical protein